jgi:serine/threonine-protein kinase
VLKAMAKSPADRYQSAAEMRADLQRAASGMPVAAPTRMDVYAPRTQRMGADTMMAAGATTSIPPVDYDDYDDRYAPARRGGGRRWIPWVLGLLLVLGVVGGAAYYLLGANKGTSIPQVTGQTVAQAERALTNAHLRFATQNVASSQYKAGLVTGSNPPEGNNVATNTLVTLLVSSGVAKVTVPPVDGQPQTQAEQTLQSKGLNNIKSNPDNTCTGTAGNVTNVNPQAGTQVDPNTQIVLTICGGGVAIIDVRNESQATAESVLKGQGFLVQVQPGTTTSNVPNGIVFNETPAPGTVLAKGSTVTIYVQNGASPTQSPSPTGSASGTLTSPPPSNTP